MKLLYPQLTNYTYENVYFGFLDILGYKKIVKEKGDEAPKYIYEIIRSALEGMEKLYENLYIKLLSDSILIWINDFALTNFINLVNIVELICQIFLRNGILIRGGISSGKHFSNNEIIVSEALIKAYSIESSNAIFPRIIIDDEVYRRVFYSDKISKEVSGKMILSENGGNRIYINDIYEKDFDGFNIINPIWYFEDIYILKYGRPSYFLDGDTIITEDEKIMLMRQPKVYINEVKEIIRKGLIENRKDINIYTKYRYMYIKFREFVLGSILEQQEKVGLLVDLNQFVD